MSSARFCGEAEQPPAAFYCDYCGGMVCQGCGYYSYETLRICDGCARRFAWTQFLQMAKRDIAKLDHWI